jgi:hypothetical protein
VFVFYFPALLAISLAFPTRQAVALSTLAIGLALFIGAVGGQAVDVLLVRGLTLGAVAVIGNVSWRLHRARIRPSAQAAREEAQDLFWGQAACLWARWSIVLGGAVLVLARAESTDQLALGIAPVVVLLLANFYLHGRYLLERPANRPLVLLASGLDLGLVAVLGLSWPGQPGLDSPVYLFLYPLVLAVGLVFPPRVAWTFGSIATAGYAVLVTLAGLHGAADLKVLVVRAIVLAAMAGLGSLYWRSVRRQARRAEGSDATSATLVWRAARAG